MSYYSKDTINKIGNAIIYLSNHISDLSKTKLLKLLYLLEETSVKQNNSPFFGIKFETWQAGPVAKEIYIDLSNGEPELLKDFIRIYTPDLASSYVKAKNKVEFCNDEFSEYDMEVMDYVIEKYGKKTATQLVRLTHKEGSAWYNTAYKYGMLELFNLKLTNNSEHEVDLTYYLSDKDLNHYIDNKESFEAFNSLKQ